MTRPDRVGVVIPAHDEEDLLGRCLESVAAAQQELAAWDAGIPSVVVVVLDDCRDATASVVQGHPEVVVVRSGFAMVGAARRCGVRQALDLLGGGSRSCWIASTDADSIVPPRWLVQQLMLAHQSVEMVLGTVIPDRTELAPTVFEEWLRQNPQRNGHSYVHGANLGIRGDTYLAAGGFALVREHEDVLLAAAVRAAGRPIVSTAMNQVVTSARTVGRTPGGFAGYLAALAG